MGKTVDLDAYSVNYTYMVLNDITTGPREELLISENDIPNSHS